MQHNNEYDDDREAAKIIAVLSAAPKTADVEESFRRTMRAVTNQGAARIQSVPQPNSEGPIISPFLMQLHTKLSLGAGALVVVLLVGYMTFNRTNPYIDISDGGIEDQSAYELFMPEDDFADLSEEPIGSPDDPATISPGAGSEPASPSSGALNVNADIATFESLFMSDDIDDATLETWVTDTSASDGLIESYDI